MSAPTRGPRYSRNASLTPPGPSAGRHGCLGNLVDVHDPRRVMECSQAARQLRFQLLVRHYLVQILHGCKNPHCGTPTCFSCVKRNPAKPHRPPTQLTARALAHYLASQDDPQNGLCPHELKMAPASMEIQDSIGINGQHGAYTSFRQNSVDVVNKRHQAKKDVKSLGQNLYDSVTMICSYSKQIPTPTTILAALHSKTHSVPPDSRLHTNSPATPLPLSGGKTATAQIDPTPQVEGQDVATQVKDVMRMSRRHSQQSLRSEHKIQSPPEVLSNGQQVHRVPYHPPNTITQSRMIKSTDNSGIDGASDSPKLSLTKTGRKSFTIGATGGGIKSSTTDAKSSLVRSKPVEKIINSNSQRGPVLPALASLNGLVMEKLKEDVYGPSERHLAEVISVVGYDSRRPLLPTKPFVNRSLFHVLSNSEALLKSFHDTSEAFKKSPLPHMDSSQLSVSFRDWNRRNGSLVYDSLWVALEDLFTPPPEVRSHKSPRSKPSRKATAAKSVELNEDTDNIQSSTPRYLSNLEAAHIVMVCVHALTSLVSGGANVPWAQLRKFRSLGVIVPSMSPNWYPRSQYFLDAIDELEYEPAVRLAERLLRAIGARTCFEHILASLDKERTSGERNSTSDTLIGIVIEHLKEVEHTAMASKERTNSSHSLGEDPGWTVTGIFLEWLRTIIVKKWTGEAVINKWSSVGTAVMLLDQLNFNYKDLNLRPTMFEMPFLNDLLDTVEDPLKFLAWEPQPNTFHILQYPALFRSQHLVAYFRTIHFTSMIAQYDHTTRVHQMQRSLDVFLREPYWWVIKSRMKVTLSDYLVLDVSREHPLRDTLDQLWGLEKRMLLKPLKVRMGQQEGEVGLDHGGVTYEFFRVVLSEAFKPENGMFTIDPQSRMTWFQPCPLEPDWKFEMLGMLFSLAIYNGITLPVTFPLCFYHFLLPTDSPIRNRGINTEPQKYIQDGWPGLAKAFQDLLSWSDGDVGEIMMRDYAFSYEVFGQKIDHNMEFPFEHVTPGKPPHDQDVSQSEPPLVTNENREQFVRDYVRYLTYLSVAPQLWAFLKGFMVCVNPRSLHLFTPVALRDLVEGTQHISVPELKRCVKYGAGYSYDHHTIVDFWAIVESFSQEDCRRLLEFVTASDRVPVTGYQSLTFHIVRIGGESESLPTSSTCFGKLYLPEYSDKQTLKRKLELAIQNSLGFGVV